MSRHCWMFSTYVVLVFISCKGDEGNYSAVMHEGEYIYGVWNARTARAAKRLVNRIERSGVNALSEMPPIPIETSLKTTELLPSDGDVEQWIRSRQPSEYDSENLYKDTFGGRPELYHSFGIVEQGGVEYQSSVLGFHPLILVEVFDMGSAENAFGIYSFTQYPGADFEWIGTRAIISGKHLSFWKGKYFVQIEGYEFATKIREGMIGLGKEVASRIKDRSEKPWILRLLPENKIPNSVKYFSDDAILSQMYDFLPREELGLGDDVAGIAASYFHKTMVPTDWTDAMVAFLIWYPSQLRATEAFDAYRASLEGHVASLTPFEQKGIMARE